MHLPMLQCTMPLPLFTRLLLLQYTTPLLLSTSLHLLQFIMPLLQCTNLLPSQCIMPLLLPTRLCIMSPAMMNLMTTLEPTSRLGRTEMVMPPVDLIL